MRLGNEPLLDDEEIEVTKKEVDAHLSRGIFITGMDREDLTQECLEHWYHVCTAYEGGKASRRTSPSIL
jgi:hypothetical protein